MKGELGPTSRRGNNALKEHIALQWAAMEGRRRALRGAGTLMEGYLTAALPCTAAKYITLLCIVEQFI